MEIDSTVLHNPMRSKCPLSLEDHIVSAANLTRLIWLILQFEEINFNDRRNLEALSELANVAADHATAARYRYLNKNDIASVNYNERNDLN